MKKSAILQMFYGDRGSFDTVVTNSWEYHKWADEEDRLCDKIKELLSPESLKLFQEYITAVEKKNIEELGDYYAEGFKFGLLIGIEAGRD